MTFLNRVITYPAHTSILYFVLSVLLSTYLRADNAADDGFSAEIGNVAASLASGNGFSDVFEINSGATAWCPPLYVLTYAIIFLLFGVKSIPAFWALIVLRALLLSVALYLLLKIDYSSKFNEYKILLILIFTGYTFLVIYRTGPKDAMFAIFLSVLVLFILNKVLTVGFYKTRWAVYIIAVLLPFANISLSLALLFFIPFVKLGLVKGAAGSVRLKQACLVVVLTFFSFSLWGLRNVDALGRFIPFKSNLWFELYISNVKDADGLLKYSNYRVCHPLINIHVREDYKTKGEVRFLDDYKNKSIEYLKQGPLDFLRKIFNRAVNIFIHAESEKDIEPVAVELFEPGDVHKLEENGLILENYWICLEENPVEFRNVLFAIDLEGDKNKILEDWIKKSEIASKRIKNTRNFKELLQSIITSSVPFIAIIFGLITPSIRNNQIFRLALLIFILSIGPYLVISWIPRYQSFQLAFFTLFVFMALSDMINLIRRKYDSSIHG